MINSERKLIRAMRRAGAKTTANPIEVKLDDVRNVLASDAMEGLLANGALTPLGVVTSVRSLVSIAADGSMSEASNKSKQLLHVALGASITNREVTNRHLTPFGPEQVAQSLNNLRALHDRVDNFERRYADMRMATQDFLDSSRATAQQLVENLENGVTPDA